MAAPRPWPIRGDGRGLSRTGGTATEIVYDRIVSAVRPADFAHVMRSERVHCGSQFEKSLDCWCLYKLNDLDELTKLAHVDFK